MSHCVLIVPCSGRPRTLRSALHLPSSSFVASEYFIERKALRYFGSMRPSNALGSVRSTLSSIDSMPSVPSRSSKPSTRTFAMEGEIVIWMSLSRLRKKTLPSILIFLSFGLPIVLSRPLITLRPITLSLISLSTFVFVRTP